MSVCVITYNHEKYISAAIEGILMQQASFPFEIIIGEDCSTDSTRSIVKEYADDNIDIIKTQFPEENRGMITNFSLVLQAAKGKYVAICEGDDYWTDPLKLQKQVDFLEANTDYSICFHNVKIWREVEQELVDDFITTDVPETTDVYLLAKENYIHTPSVIVRKNDKVLPDIEKLGKLSVGDYPLYMLYAKYGKIKKLQDCMAVYRHGTGVWSVNEDIEYKYSSWLDLLEKLCVYFKDDEVLVNNLKEQCGDSAHKLYLYFKDVDNIKSKKYFLYAIKHNFNFLIAWLKDSDETILSLTKELNSIQNSKAYRLGKFLLKPFSFLHLKK